MQKKMNGKEVPGGLYKPERSTEMEEEGWGDWFESSSTCSTEVLLVSIWECDVEEEEEEERC